MSQLFLNAPQLIVVVLEYSYRVFVPPSGCSLLHFPPSSHSWTNINNSVFWIWWINLPLPDSCGLSCSARCFFPSHSCLFLFPFPLRAPKSKLLLLLRSGLCNSDLCNRIANAQHTEHLQPAECVPACRVKFFCFFSSDLHYWPLVSERETERDVGEITEAVTVRMRLSVRAAECADCCSQVGRRTQKHSEKDFIDFPQTHTATTYRWTREQLQMAVLEPPRAVTSVFLLDVAESKTSQETNFIHTSVRDIYPSAPISAEDCCTRCLW